MPNHTIETRNPANGSRIQTYSTHTPAEIDKILARSGESQKKWRSKTPEDRAQLIKKIGETLLRDKARLAELISLEMGKSPAEAVAEIEKCANCAEFYAALGPDFLNARKIPTEAKRSTVVFEPLGTVLAIMPWNFPFWQALRCAIPALLAGNTVVLKHASNVTGCALAVADVVAEATSDAGLLQAVIAPGKEAEALIGRAEIHAVSFTGSTDVGRAIAANAGKNLKKCVLELGGSDAYVVLADADLDLAARICAKSRLLNSGQSCISAKRFIVEKSVYPAFREKFLSNLKSTKIAPMAREDLREELHQQVLKSVKQGAQLLCGGVLPSEPGCFYPPTLLAGVRPGMEVFDQETFGPVAALVQAENEEEAITLANRSQFGLGAAIFTKNDQHGEEIARRQLEAGSCFVNEMVKSDSRLPFGGTKDSGFGRELSEFGILEFVNIKTVYVGAN